MLRKTSVYDSDRILVARTSQRGINPMDDSNPGESSIKILFNVLLRYLESGLKDRCADEQEH